MALCSTLLCSPPSFSSPVNTKVPTHFTPGIPPPASAIQLRNTLVFGILGTFLAAVGIVFTGMMFRIMRRADRGERVHDSSSVTREIELNPVGDGSTAGDAVGERDSELGINSGGDWREGGSSEA